MSDIAVSDTAVSESTAAGPLKCHVCQVRATLMRALYIVLFSTPMVFGSMFALAVFFVSCLLIGCIQYCCPPLLHSFAALAALLCRPSHASYSKLCCLLHSGARLCVPGDLHSGVRSSGHDSPARAGHYPRRRRRGADSIRCFTKWSEQHRS